MLWQMYLAFMEESFDVQNGFSVLIKELLTSSVEFVVFWNCLKVKPRGDGFKRLQTPKQGSLALTCLFCLTNRWLLHLHISII